MKVRARAAASVSERLALRPRAGFGVVAPCVAVLAFLVGTSAGPGAAAVSGSEGSDSSASYVPAARFTDHQFPLMYYGRLERTDLSDLPTTDRHSTDERYIYFGQAALSARPGSDLDIRFAVEEQPGSSSYRFCGDTASCSDILVKVRADSGLLYLYAQRGPGTAYFWLGGFEQQPLELSASDEDSDLKIYREVLVTPSPRASGCEDYREDTPVRFTCLFLRELIPSKSSAISEDVDEAALRTALPPLVQDHENYRLVLAEEFSGTPPPADSSGCRNGLSTLDLEIWNTYDACSSVDKAGTPCANIADGHLYIAHTTRCNVDVRSFGKFHFKYGYVEIKYTVNTAYHLLSRQNYNAIMYPHGDRLRYLHDRYGIVIDDWEDLLKYNEVEIDIFEYIPNGRSSLSHQYSNWKGLHRKAPLSPTSSVKHLNLCKEHSSSIVLNPDLPCDDNESFTITHGIEWTPRGYVSYIAIDGIQDEMTAIPKDKIGVSIKPSSIGPDGHVSYGGTTSLSGEAKDSYFENFDPEGADLLLEQVATAHLPLPIAVGTWGNARPSGHRIRTRMDIDYIRVWQPENRYTDMEPAYR